MQKTAFILFLLISPFFSLAGSGEFNYDKDVLSAEFNELDKIAAYVEETNMSYAELSSNPEFKGQVFTNTLGLKPTLQFEDLDWGSFAWGFCCFPIGIFTVLINDNKDKNSKESFWAGLGSIVIVLPIAYAATVIAAISIGEF